MEIGGTSLSTKSCHSPRLSQESTTSTKGHQRNGSKDTVASKTPIKKSQPRLQSQQSAVTGTEGKTVKSSTKPAEAESQSPKACVSKDEENNINSVNPPICKNGIATMSEKNPDQNDEPIMSSPNPEIMPLEVTVGG